MNKNLPQKYNKNFFAIFWKKLTSLFNKDKTKHNRNMASYNDFFFENKEHVDKNSFKSNLKIQNNINLNNYEKKEFINNLTENPSLLKNFSNDRLEQILQYYLEENQRKRKILEKYRYLS